MKPGRPSHVYQVMVLAAAKFVLNVAAILLPDNNRVLLAGGRGDGREVLASAEPLVLYMRLPH